MPNAACMLALGACRLNEPPLCSLARRQLDISIAKYVELRPFTFQGVHLFAHALNGALVSKQRVFRTRSHSWTEPVRTT
jgi:hypothetical protein